MLNKKIILTSLSILGLCTAAPAWAKAELNLDLGYTQESGFSGTTSNNNINSLGGYNFNLSLLAPFSNDNIIPLLGGSLNYINVSGSKNNVNTLFSSTALEVNGGLKLKSFPFSLYGLLNLGFGIANNLSESVGGYNNVSSVNSHTIFGGTIGGVYRLSPRVDLGLEATYNSHTMTINYFAGSSETTNFNETSIDLALNFSL